MATAHRRPSRAAVLSGLVGIAAVAVLALGSPRPSPAATNETTRGHVGAFYFDGWAGPLSSFHFAGLVDASPAAAPTRILYSSDWSGSGQIYAVDPSGRAPVGQLTFGRAPSCRPGNPCGYVAPLPSPDGRRVLVFDFVDQGPFRSGLFVAQADGQGRRQLASVYRVYALDGTAASWSPDSSRIAYAVEDGIHVVNADGTRDRRLDADGRDVHAPAWSPDGRSIAFLSHDVLSVAHDGNTRALGEAPSGFAWSPTGRWIAYTSPRGLFLIRPDGRGRRRLIASYSHDVAWSADGRLLSFSGSDGLEVVDAVTGRVRVVSKSSWQTPAWAPHGRLLAFSGAQGIQLADAAAHVRVLTTERARELVWSPDGGSLAFVAERPRSEARPWSPYSIAGLEVVTLRGSVRTVVPAAGPHGGVIGGLVWVRPPAGTRFRPPPPRLLAATTPSELVARWPVERLAANGDRVAYVACGHVFAWSVATGDVEQAEPQSSLSPRCSSSTYYAGMSTGPLALAGDRVAYTVAGGGNTTVWWLGGVSLSGPRAEFELGSGYATRGCVLNPLAGALVGWPAGSGDLLAFSTWREVLEPGGCLPRTTTQSILRAEPEGCPCGELASSPGPFIPYDVESGRIVAGGDNATVIYDRAGTQLLSVPVSPLAAQLSGTDLVVLARGQLRHYDARTGKMLHTWALPDVSSGAECGRVGCGTLPRLVLEDALRGLVTYVLDGQVHVLRLADGSDAVVAPGTLARFMDAGLVYADGSRLHLVPFDQLPPR